VGGALRLSERPRTARASGRQFVVVLLLDALAAGLLDLFDLTGLEQLPEILGDAVLYPGPRLVVQRLGHAHADRLGMLDVVGGLVIGVRQVDLLVEFVEAELPVRSAPLDGVGELLGELPGQRMLGRLRQQFAECLEGLVGGLSCGLLASS
jgi:hypothetical protein